MEFPRIVPFLQHLGCELQRFDNGHAVIALTAQPHQLNALGMVHGGVLMTLLDASMGHASRSSAPPSEQDELGVVTVEMKTTFMRPAVGRIRAHGEVIHRTSSMAFCQSSIWVAGADGQDVLAAQATGTFRLLSMARGRALTTGQTGSALNTRQPGSD